MGTETQSKTIEQLKKEIADKDAKPEEQREREQERKFESLDEEVKDIKKRIVPELYNKDAAHDKRILELEIAHREAKSEAKKSSLTIAGGGVSIVVLLEALQAYLGLGGAG